jgi:hypothetical protein
MTSMALFGLAWGLAVALALRRRYAVTIRRRRTALMALGLAVVVASGTAYLLVGGEAAWWILSTIAGIAGVGIAALVPSRRTTGAEAPDVSGAAWTAPGGGGDGV